MAWVEKSRLAVVLVVGTLAVASAVRFIQACLVARACYPVLFGWAGRSRSGWRGRAFRLGWVDGCGRSTRSGLVDRVEFADRWSCLFRLLVLLPLAFQVSVVKSRFSSHPSLAMFLLSMSLLPQPLESFELLLFVDQVVHARQFLVFWQWVQVLNATLFTAFAMARSLASAGFAASAASAASAPLLSASAVVWVASSVPSRLALSFSAPLIFSWVLVSLYGRYLLMYLRWPITVIIIIIASERFILSKFFNGKSKSYSIGSIRGHQMRESLKGCLLNISRAKSLMIILFCTFTVFTIQLFLVCRSGV